MKKEEKIKQLQDQLESVKQELEALKNQKEVLRWEDLDSIEGYEPNDEGSVNSYSSGHGYSACAMNLTFKTKEQAIAAIALAKISQLLPVYNEGWEPDFRSESIKDTIWIRGHEIDTGGTTHHREFLCFKSPEIRDKFLEHNRDLIEQAKPLL